MRAYTEFSRFYDAMMHDVDYAGWSSYLCELLHLYGARTVLDVACGTGNITVPLSRAGFCVTGVDSSPDMLDVAQRKARNLGAQIPFVCQDMLALSVHKPADAVVCCCDGVNYLTSLSEVRTFFTACSRALKPNGVLLFDVSSAYKLEHVLGNETFTEITDAYAYIWQNCFDVKTRLCQMDVCFFVKNGGQYDRFSEQHIQRAHAAEELSNEAVASGFSVRSVYTAGTKTEPSQTCERIQFVLEKE